MNTIIYIPPTNTKESPPPNCPHCDKPLKGFSKDSEFTFGEFIVSAVLILFVLLQLAGIVTGFIDSEYHLCQTLGEKRWHYILPTKPLACQLGRWLNNEEYLTKKDREEALKNNVD